MLEKFLQLVNWRTYSSSQDQIKSNPSSTETPEEFDGYSDIKKSKPHKKPRDYSVGAPVRSSSASSSSYDNSAGIYAATSSTSDSGSSYSSCDSGSSYSSCD